MADAVLVWPVAPLTRSHALTLVQRIQSHDWAPGRLGADTPHSGGAAAADDAEQPRLEPEESAGPDLSWTIRNKYYEAEVQLRVADETLSSPARDGAETAVIVLAAADATPSPATASVLSDIASRSDAPDVCVLASVPLSPLSSEHTSAIPDDDDAWDDLALAHGFEWIRLTAEEVHSSPSAASSSAPDPVGGFPAAEKAGEEEDGIAAVVAALHAATWEGMRVLPRASGAAHRRSEGADRSRGDHTGADGDDGGGGGDMARYAPNLGAAAAGTRRRPATPPDSAQWTFPSTFLPSIPRPDHGATRADLAGAAAPAAPASAFEVDFSPFVSAGDEGTSRQDDENGDDNPFLRPEFSGLDWDEVEDRGEDSEDLDALFARVSLARKEAQSMDFDARRDFAERMVRELLG